MKPATTLLAEPAETGALGVQQLKRFWSRTMRLRQGQAGDLIIWHHALPHGSRPNHAKRPRIVQYINMRPARMEVREQWL